MLAIGQFCFTDRGIKAIVDQNVTMCYPGRQLNTARALDGDATTRFRELRYNRQDVLRDRGHLTGDVDVVYFLIASETTLTNGETYVDWLQEITQNTDVPVPCWDITTHYEPYSRGVKSVYGGDRHPERRIYLHDSGIAEAVIHEVSDSYRTNEIPKQILVNNTAPYLRHVQRTLEGADVADDAGSIYAAATFYQANQIELLDTPPIEEVIIQAPVVTLEDADEAAETMVEALRRDAISHF